VAVAVKAVTVEIGTCDTEYRLIGNWRCAFAVCCVTLEMIFIVCYNRMCHSRNSVYWLVLVFLVSPLVRCVGCAAFKTIITMSLFWNAQLPALVQEEGIALLDQD
jgi:hypothetical protein